jgi:hypothetical protein
MVTLPNVCFSVNKTIYLYCTATERVDGGIRKVRFISLFWLHYKFFSYLVAVTIMADRAANLVLCLAVMAFSSEGYFMCLICCDMGHPFWSYPKDP